MCDDISASAIITSEDCELYMLAKDRIEHDSGERYTMDEVFGEDYRPVDDGYEPEFA